MTTKGKVILTVSVIIGLIAGGFVLYEFVIKGKPNKDDKVGEDDKKDTSGGGTKPPSGGSNPKPIPDPVIIPKPIIVGSTVAATKSTPGGTGAWRTTIYKEGGTDGKGHIGAGSYAGVVKEINKGAKSVRVENYKNAMRSGNANVYEFWLSLDDIKAT